MAVTDPMAWPIQRALMDCLCDELSDNPVERCCPLPGTQIAISDCCSDAWVQIVEVAPFSDPFPRQAGVIGDFACPEISGWMATFRMGVARCAPVMDEHGNMPSCAEMAAAAELQAADMHSMRRAVYCCDWRGQAGADGARFVIRSSAPLQGYPSGTCMAATLTVTAELCGAVCDGGE